MDMAGWPVIVTGGASGIGLATARLLAERGARVAIADLNGEAVQRASAEIAGSIGIAVDVTDEAAVAAMVARTVEAFGPLRGAVNAAGLPMCGKRLDELDLADFDRNIGVNLRGLFLCLREEVRAMLAGGGGTIVNVASGAALSGVARGAEYCASKAGVAGLTRAAAADFATDGIRVNAVMPGGTMTPMLQAAMDQDPGMADLLAAAHPMNRYAQPPEIAGAIAWLLSDSASFVTGIGLSVDGGQSSITHVPPDRG